MRCARKTKITEENRENMKGLRLLALLFALCLLAGCLKETTPPRINDPASQAGNNNLLATDGNPLRHDVIKQRYGSVTAFSELFKKGFFWIETFSEYLAFLDEYDIAIGNAGIKSYDKKFFASHGLMLMFVAETSGSHQINIGGLYEDETDGLTLVIDRKLPPVGTCDMAYYKFVIAYEKPERKYDEVCLKVVNTFYQELKGLEINDEASIQAAAEYLAENKDEIVDIELRALFLEEGPFDKESNERNVEKYGLNRLNGTLSVMETEPWVKITFASADDVDLDLLLEIAGVDDLIRLSLYIYWGHVETEKNRVSKTETNALPDDSVNKPGSDANDEPEDDPDDIPDNTPVNPGTGLDYEAFQKCHYSYINSLKDSDFFRIDTYQDYLDFVSAHDISSHYPKINDYDADFFTVSGLIIFYKMEPSGSITLEVEGLYQDDNGDLAIVINRNVPFVCDDAEAYHLFALEYVKPDQSAEGTYVIYESSYINIKTFPLKTAADKNAVSAFLAEHEDEIIDIVLTARFLETPREDELDVRGMKYYYYNQRNVEKYGLSRVKASIQMNGIVQSVCLTYLFTEDLDLDLLLEIAGIDDLIELTLDILYDYSKISISHYPFASDEELEDPEPDNETEEGRKLPVRFRGLAWPYSVPLKDGMKRIDTYQDYLDFVSANGQIILYNESFFETNGLVIYSYIEPSGSNSHIIQGVYLDDNNNMTIRVHRYVPMIGTCDIRTLKTVIEYEKPENGINNITIKFINTHEAQKYFELTSSEAVAEAKEFVDRKRSVINNVTASMSFSGNPDLERLAQVKAELYVASNFAYANLTFSSLDDLDFDLLWEIATTDAGISKLSVSVYFRFTMILYVPVN
jgi:hypothetical protein